MSALLLKDFYTMKRELLLTPLVFTLLFLFLPLPIYAILWALFCGLLPFLSASQDQHSRWDQLSAALPYSDRDRVLSRCLPGWVSLLFMAAVTALLSAARMGSFFFVFSMPSPRATLLALSCGLLLMDLTVPILFRLGAEQGRFYVLLAELSLLSLFPILSAQDAPALYILCAGLALSLVPLSVWLSLRYCRTCRR